MTLIGMGYRTEWGCNEKKKKVICRIWYREHNTLVKTEILKKNEVKKRKCLPNV